MTKKNLDPFKGGSPLNNSVPLSREAWLELKASEAYGMYADAMGKFDDLKGRVDELVEENFEVHKELLDLKRRLAEHMSMNSYCPHTDV